MILRTAFNPNMACYPAVPTIQYEPRSYEQALLTLGKILLTEAGESFTSWMSLRKISGQCRKHASQLPCLSYSVKSFTEWAIPFFMDGGDVLDGYTQVRFISQREPSQRNPKYFISFIKRQPYQIMQQNQESTPAEADEEQDAETAITA